MAVDDGHISTIYTANSNMYEGYFNGYINQNPNIYLQRITSICKTPTVLLTNFASTYIKVLGACITCDP